MVPEPEQVSKVTVVDNKLSNYCTQSILKSMLVIGMLPVLLYSSFHSKSKDHSSSDEETYFDSLMKRITKSYEKG